MPTSINRRPGYVSSCYDVICDDWDHTCRALDGVGLRQVGVAIVATALEAVITVPVSYLIAQAILTNKR
jgi:hypothetical protein